MHMPVGGVVVVHSGDKLNGRAVALLQFQHGGAGQGFQIKVFVLVLAPGVRAEDNAVVVAAFLRRFMNHLVGGLFGKIAVKTEEIPGHLPAVKVPAVRDVADVGYGASLLPSSLLAVVGFDDQTGLPPFPV